MSFWNQWRKLHWQVRAWSTLGRWRTRHDTAGAPRVLHISPSWFADASCVGGGERYPTELARAMSKLVPTRLLSFGSQPSVHRENDLELEILQGFPLDGHVFDPFPGRGLAQAIRRCDIVHVHQWKTAASQLSVAIASGLGKKVFVTDHGGAASDLSERYGLANLVTGFLPVSKFSTPFLPCPPDAVVLGGGVPEPFLLDAPGSWPRGPARVIFLGRLMPHKGLDLLIRACGTEVPLSLIGRPYDPEYLAHLQQLAEGRDVEFVFDADDAEVGRRLRSATVLVLPSVHKDCYGNEHAMPELLGLVMLEAMACGTPVICTTAGGMGEFVLDGQTGRIVPWGDVDALADALREIVSDPAKAAEMGRRARADVEERHTWTHVARRCLAAYLSA